MTDSVWRSRLPTDFPCVDGTFSNCATSICPTSCLLNKASVTWLSMRMFIHQWQKLQSGRRGTCSKVQRCCCDWNVSLSVQRMTGLRIYITLNAFKETLSRTSFGCPTKPSTCLPFTVCMIITVSYRENKPGISTTQCSHNDSLQSLQQHELHYLMFHHEHRFFWAGSSNRLRVLL